MLNSNEKFVPMKRRRGTSRRIRIILTSFLLFHAYVRSTTYEYTICVISISPEIENETLEWTYLSFLFWTPPLLILHTYVSRRIKKDDDYVVTNNNTDVAPVIETLTDTSLGFVVNHARKLNDRTKFWNRRISFLPNL